MGKKIGHFLKYVLFIAIITERSDTCNTQIFNTKTDIWSDTMSDTWSDISSPYSPKIRLIKLGFNTYGNLFL